MACPSAHLPRCPQWPKALHHFINVLHQARVWVGGGLRLVAGGGSCGLAFFPTKQQYLLSPTYPYVLFRNKGALRPLKMHELMLTLQMLKLEGRRNICTYSIPKCDFSLPDEQGKDPPLLIWGAHLGSATRCWVWPWVNLHPPYNEQLG